MASTYLSKTFGTYDSTQIFTLSAWVKKSSNTTTNQTIYGKDGAVSSRSQIILSRSDNDQFRFFDDTDNTAMDIQTNRVFRDINSWYHIVVAVDTTQATASNRVKLYVNGTQETSFATSTYPAQNSNLKALDSAKDTFIGVSEISTGSKTGYYFDGEMAHVHFIDGTQYAASDFGETESSSGIWKPIISPSVTYGTNGFFLKFQDSSALGDDSSGNTNDFTVNGTGTQTLDTPSNVFCTLNALDKDSAVTLSNGNLTSTGGQNKGFRATQAFSQGKWYWEVKWNSGGGAPVIGIADDAYTTSSYLGSTSKSWGYYNLGDYYNNASTNSYGNSFASGDIIGVALDADNGYLYFSKNGTFQNSGDPTSGATGTGGISVSNPRNGFWFPAGSNQTGTNISFNFGNGYFGTTAVSSAESDTAGLGQFEYSVPSGYYALCTKNIAEYG